MRAALSPFAVLLLCIGCKSSSDNAPESMQNSSAPPASVAPPEGGGAGRATPPIQHDSGPPGAPERDAATPDAGADAATDAGSPPSTPCMVMAEDARLPGVRLRIEGDSCRLETKHDHSFRYVLEVDDPIMYYSPATFSGCGRCGGYTSDPRSLIDFSIGADDVWYCLCDTGCCPQTTTSMQTLQTGTFEGGIDWPGRQWHGPSDTDVPLGPGFPAGDYAVSVTFSVPNIGSITARLPIEVYGDPGPVPKSCQVDGVVYVSGQGGIPDPRSCSNSCTCNDGELECPDLGCPEPCPTGMVYGTSCVQCGPTDACEVVQTGCLLRCDTAIDCSGFSGACTDGLCKDLCG
jgi:hypothetical protein